jgi:MFS family permease
LPRSDCGRRTARAWPSRDARARGTVLALGADYALFLIGLSFASPSTIVTAFVAMLGASNLVVGAIPAVVTLGWQLPSLFVAGHTQTLEKKQPFVLRYTVWERVPFLVLALVAFFVATPWPGLAIVTTLAMMLVVTATGGLLMPAWMDIVGRAVPVALRGRFFASASTVAAVGGLAGSFLTAYVLGVFAGPYGYGVCFLIAALFMGLSYIAFTLAREPTATPPSPRVGVGAHLRTVPARLSGDPNFSWFLAARALAVVGAMAHGFYTVYALRRLEAPVWYVGVFTAMLFAGELVGNLAFGWIADTVGHRVVIIAGTAATVAANAVALATGSLSTFSIVFALAGLQIASLDVSNLNVLLEFAPSEEEQPTYVGVGNTLVAPMAFASPLMAGLLADSLGFTAVFRVAALFGVLALGVLLARVRDPRRAAPVPSG